MDQSELLSGIIGDIYDAALDSSLWTDVAGKAAQVVGGLSGTLFSRDAVSMSGDIYRESGGISDTFRRLYFDSYIKVDPLVTPQFFAEIYDPTFHASPIAGRCAFDAASLSRRIAPEAESATGRRPWRVRE